MNICSPALRCFYEPSPEVGVVWQYWMLTRHISHPNTSSYHIVECHIMMTMMWCVPWFPRLHTRKTSWCVVANMHVFNSHDIPQTSYHTLPHVVLCTCSYPFSYFERDVMHTWITQPPHVFIWCQHIVGVLWRWCMLPPHDFKNCECWVAKYDVVCSLLNR
jgi:hypothetical protein